MPMIEKNCERCGIVLLIKPSVLKVGKGKYCSPTCRNESQKTHGASRTRIFSIWRTMKRRCTDEDYRYFKDYGGRGIKVCPEWEEPFETFREWALANGYQDDLQIDRKENDLGYCPDNCRFATPSQNGQNRRGHADRESKHKSVCRDGKKWRALIMAFGKNHHIGLFSTEEEAARACDAKAKELHGEFAYLNFKDTTL